MIHFSDFKKRCLSHNREERRDAISEALEIIIEKKTQPPSIEDFSLLITLLADEEIEIKRLAGIILTHFSTERSPVFIQMGGLPICIQLLGNADEEVRELAVIALFNLLWCYENQCIFMELNGLNALLPLVYNEEKETIILVTQILENLLRESNFQWNVVQSGYLPMIISLLEREEEIQTNILVILHHLSRNTRTQGALTGSDVLPKLQMLIENRQGPEKSHRFIRSLSQEILEILDRQTKSCIQNQGLYSNQKTSNLSFNTSLRK